jgi:hypothetical protein
VEDVLEDLSGMIKDAIKSVKKTEVDSKKRELSQV